VSAETTFQHGFNIRKQKQKMFDPFRLSFGQVHGTWSMEDCSEIIAPSVYAQSRQMRLGHPLREKAPIRMQHRWPRPTVLRE
jgi:hypothetical protein